MSAGMRTPAPAMRQRPGPCRAMSETARIAGLFPIPMIHAKAALSPEACNVLLGSTSATPARINHMSDALSHSEPFTFSGAPPLESAGEVLLSLTARLGEALFGETLDWSIKEAWLNRLGPGGEQAMHAHANSVVSGVLYLRDVHPSARLVFHRAVGTPEFVLSNFNERTRVTPFNAPRQQSGPTSAGDVILFPSYLLHSVPRNDGGERVSIAFNAIPDRLETWGYQLRFAP